MNRREFLFTLAAAGTTSIMKSYAANPSTSFKTQLKKALIRPRLTPAVVEEMKAAGFCGVELQDKSVSLAVARDGLRCAQDNGLTIHSFMGGWFDFNTKDATKRAATIDTAKRNIELTEAYGAPVMLIVPGRVGGIEIPKPSEFNLDFDPSTLMLKRATIQGGFAAYIAAQNDATHYAQDALGELIPFAAAHGVILGVENVWNNLWVLPEFASAFVRSFQSPWVKFYLDMGNHVRYAPTEKWLTTLADQIVKLHIKDFMINRAEKNEGHFTRLGEGSINWCSVRQAIETAGYNGWVSVEENYWTTAEYSEKLDLFIHGKLASRVVHG